MKFTFSAREIKELAISAVVLAFVFAWYMHGGVPLPSTVAVSLVGVSLAFICHELSHKIVAQKYGCYAEYRMWESGLILSFFLVIALGIIFAAPGAVYIMPGYYSISRRENGVISAAGASANLGLAVIFYIIGFRLGVIINAWLALFNMLPFPPLDGSKVIAWSKPIWLTICIVAFFMMSIV